MTRSEQLYREGRFFILSCFIVGLLIYFLTPPLSVRKTYFKQISASPGEVVTLVAEGYWWRQCPATVRGRWLDERTKFVVATDKPIEGGRALASFARQVNEYKKQIPFTTTFGYKLPKRLCYQALTEHRCGIISLSSKSPLTCLTIQ